MDQNGTGAQQATRSTCTNQTCMFFGSASTEGYCSVCYKAELKKRDEKLQKSNSNTNTNIGNTNTNDHQSTLPPSNSTPPIAISSANLNSMATSMANSMASSMANSIKINSSSPNSSNLNNNIHSPNSTSASMANSAPVPTTATSLISSLGSNSTSTTPNPSISSKRRNDDSICSSLSDLDGTPSGKKTNSDSPSKPKKKRCGVCKKKLGLTGFPCHCGSMFCPLHRYADQHGCSYDYAKAGKDQLRKDNPVVQDDKIVKF